jgi:hypothetical protein
MWAKASIFRIGPFWPRRRTRLGVVDDGRALTRDEPAVIDEALALGVVSASLLPGHGCRSAAGHRLRVGGRLLVVLVLSKSVK